MQSVAVTGYLATGSGALVGLLKEYSNTDTGRFPENYEQIFLYDVNGVFETIDKLIYSNSLLNSNAYINQFRAEMQRLNNIDFGWFGGYKYLCKDAFIEVIENFINRITSYHIYADWYGTYDKKSLSIDRIVKDTVNFLLGRKKTFHNFGKKTTMIKDNKFEFSFASPKILQDATKDLIANYLDIFFEKDKIAVLDHFFLPQDSKRVESFTPKDFKLIMVDRDIRDLFILNKYIWVPVWGENTYFPTDVHEFIEFTKSYRATEEIVNCNRILKIKFEDLIYNYETTKSIVEQFIGLDPNNHIEQYKYFDPRKSIKNTQLFNIKPEWKKESEIIKKSLSGMTYNFPYSNKTSVEELFDG